MRAAERRLVRGDTLYLSTGGRWSSGIERWVWMLTEAMVER